MGDFTLHEPDTINFENGCLDQLSDLVNQARKERKHVFLWDRTGLVPLFFDGMVGDFTDQMVEVALAKRNSQSDIKQKLKDALVLLK